MKETTIYNPYGFIYITTNDIDGKKYVGQRKFDKNSEWKKYLGSGKILQCAIRKHGKEHFSKEIVCICYSKDELNKAEIDIIHHLNASQDDNYYNITLGGDGGPKPSEEHYKKLKQKYENGELWNNTRVVSDDQVVEIIRLFYQGLSNIEISERVNVSAGIVNNIRNHITFKHLTNGLVFPKQVRKSNRRRKINQYSLDGNYISTYNNVFEIEEKYNIKPSEIIYCCNGVKAYTHGYIWKYSDQDNIVPLSLLNCMNRPIPKNSKKVIQLTKTGEFCAIYNCVADAARSFGKRSGSRISSCARHETKACYGYVWIYEDEYNRLIEEKTINAWKDA